MVRFQEQTRDCSWDLVRVQPPHACTTIALTGTAEGVGDDPGTEKVEHGRLGTAISTSTRGNATAFGFSITITASFGMLQTLVGSPTVAQVLLFAVAAALTIGALEATVTRGFRLRAGTAPTEVSMFGTALNFVSAAAGAAAAAGVGSLVHGTWAWPLGACVATAVFLFAESAEILLAEFVQKTRGDPEAKEEEDEA